MIQMARKKNISIYISWLLRHKPEEIGLKMDQYGWVSVDELINGINKAGKYSIDRNKLEEIVEQDKKGRFKFDENHLMVKACQGHSISWVTPEMEYIEPPEFLYHGTTTSAAEKIMSSGGISKMNRHAVHMQADIELAWQSALRWHMIPVVLKIDAKKMYRSGFVFGKTENNVWCTDHVPDEFIIKKIEK